MFAGWPDGLRQELIERHVSAAWWQVGVRERSTMTEGNGRMYAALAASSSHGELRALDGARHSTLTTDQAGAVVQAACDLLAHTTR